MSLVLVSSPHTDVLELAFCIAAHLSYALPIPPGLHGSGPWGHMRIPA